MPPHHLDRTFITSLARSSEGHALTHTLIQLGKALGLETLAEGIEEHDQVTSCSWRDATSRRASSSRDRSAPKRSCTSSRSAPLRPADG